MFLLFGLARMSKFPRDAMEFNGVGLSEMFPISLDTLYTHTHTHTYRRKTVKCASASVAKRGKERKKDIGSKQIPFFKTCIRKVLSSVLWKFYTCGILSHLVVGHHLYIKHLTKSSQPYLDNQIPP